MSRNTILDKYTSTVSIGFERGDGDFAIVATVNNNDGHLSQSDLLGLIEAITKFYAYTGEPVVVIDRQDTPDYVNLDE